MTIERQKTNARMSQIVKHNGTVYLAGQVPTDFSADIAEGCAPVQVQFSDASMDAITWEWKANGTTIETSQNPNITFDVAGIYEICLTVTVEPHNK